MPGIWMTRIARQLTRPDTFERLVSPAIADLQTEAAQGGIRRLRHYAALTMVLGCAVARDFRIDIKTAFEPDTLHDVWARATIWYLGIVGVMTLTALRGSGHWSWGVGTFLATFETEGAMPWHLLSAAQTMDAVSTSLLDGVVSAMPFAMAAAAFFLCRQNRRRTIIAVAIIAVMATAIVGLGVRPIRSDADRALYEEVAPQVADPGVAVGDTLHWRKWLKSRQRELDDRIAFWTDVQNAMMAVPFALFGVVLARRRGWGVLGGAVQIVLTLALVMMLCSLFPLPPFPLGRLIGVTAMVVAGVLRLWLDGSREPLRMET